MDSKPPQTLAKPYKYLPSLKAEEVEKKKRKDKNKKRNINKKHECRSPRA